MKIFFVTMGSAVIISGAAISAFMLIDRQFVLFRAWDIALVFAASLLISVIPFAMAVILTQQEKLERIQKDDYNLLERKMNMLEKLIKNLEQKLTEEPKAHMATLEETPITEGGEVNSINESDIAPNPASLLSPPPPIRPYIPSQAQTYGKESLSALAYKGMKLNKIVRIALFSVGIVCLLLSAYYLFQLIFQLRWDDTNIRVPQLIQFFGGVIFITLSKILKNQEKIIRLSLKRRTDIDNAGLIDNKRASGDAARQ